MGSHPFHRHGDFQKRSVLSGSIFQISTIDAFSFFLPPPTDKPYRNEHITLVRFNSDGKIAELKEFFDTKEVHDHLDEHEPAEVREKKKSAS